MYQTRKYVFQVIVFLTGFILLSKLFSIQVLSSEYKDMAESNIVMEIIEYPFRGLIYDRNDQLLVENVPEYDIYVTPKNVIIHDTLELCNLLQIERQELIEKLTKARKYSYVKSSLLIKQISQEHFASIQDKLVNFSGFDIQARTKRNYPDDLLSNAMGYIAEISKPELDRDSIRYYRQGDYIGKSGVESFYELQLRGQRGKKFRLKNVSGVEKGKFRDGEYDTLAVPGINLQSSIDLELQKYAQKLMDGKVGSVVAIEPKTGEILSMVSSPFYDPNLLTGAKYSQNFTNLTKDSLKPLFNRPIMAMYPPGSIFKNIQALIAMQEGVIDAEELVYCDGTLIGDHAPPGLYDMHEAIKYSSNNYFFKLFRRIINQNEDPNTFIDSRIGLQTWKNYLTKFGLGHPLGVDIPNEKGGHIPGLDYYDKIYGENRWKFSTIASLSIGQGEMLLSPLQMANLGCIIANKGYYFTPHIIRNIEGNDGPLPEYTTKNDVGIDAEYFDVVSDAMEDALKGTAWRAVIPGIAICGKTGTAENPHGEDHSVFMAYAPKEDPKIVISVYVENAGWGGRAAASTASLIIEKYLKKEVERIWLEEYVIKGDFLDKKPTENNVEEEEDLVVTEDEVEVTLDR